MCRPSYKPLEFPVEAATKVRGEAKGVDFAGLQVLFTVEGCETLG